MTHTFVTVWSQPGFCLNTQPDCPLLTANVTTCRFDSYSVSWTAGEKMYSYNYEWGNDRDCPKLYKCCNGQGGIGTCVRAAGPEPGERKSCILNLTVWPVDWLRVSGEPSDILVSSVQSGQSPKEKLSI